MSNAYALPDDARLHAITSSRMACIISSIVVTILVFQVSPSRSMAQDPENDVLPAVKEWKTSVARARAELVEAIEKRIKAAAEDEQYDLVGILIEQRTALETQGQIPSHPILILELTDFAIARTEASLRLARSYRDLVSRLESDKLDSVISRQHHELRALLKGQLGISILPHAGVASTDDSNTPMPEWEASDEDGNEPTELNESARMLREYVKLISTEQANVLKAPTSVLRDEAMRRYRSKARSYFEARTRIVLSFPILDVAALSQGVRLQLGPPRELVNVDGIGRVLSSFSMPMSKPQALATKPGDLLVVSGDPEVVDEEGGGLLYLLTISTRQDRFVPDSFDSKIGGDEIFQIWLKDAKSKVYRRR